MYTQVRKVVNSKSLVLAPDQRSDRKHWKITSARSGRCPKPLDVTTITNTRKENKTQDIR